MSNFIEQCLKGEVMMDEVDDFIEEWHETDTNLKIYQFLGMTKKEYSLFVQDDAYLATIITARKEKTDIETVVESQIAIAARSDDQTKSKKLERWLKDQGLWE